MAADGNRTPAGECILIHTDYNERNEVVGKYAELGCDSLPLLLQHHMPEYSFVVTKFIDDAEEDDLSDDGSNGGEAQRMDVQVYFHDEALLREVAAGAGGEIELMMRTSAGNEQSDVNGGGGGGGVGADGRGGGGGGGVGNVAPQPVVRQVDGAWLWEIARLKWGFLVHPSRISAKLRLLVFGCLQNIDIIAGVPLEAGLADFVSLAFLRALASSQRSHLPFVGFSVDDSASSRRRGGVPGDREMLTELFRLLFPRPHSLRAGESADVIRIGRRLGLCGFKHATSVDVSAHGHPPGPGRGAYSDAIPRSLPFFPAKQYRRTPYTTLRAASSTFSPFAPSAPSPSATATGGLLARRLAKMEALYAGGTKLLLPDSPRFPQQQALSHILPQAAPRQLPLVSAPPPPSAAAAATVVNTVIPDAGGDSLMDIDSTGNDLLDEFLNSPNSTNSNNTNNSSSDYTMTLSAAPSCSPVSTTAEDMYQLSNATAALYSNHHHHHHHHQQHPQQAWAPIPPLNPDQNQAPSQAHHLLSPTEMVMCGNGGIPAVVHDAMTMDTTDLFVPPPPNRSPPTKLTKTGEEVQRKTQGWP